jgi:hypothetical protein
VIKVGFHPAADRELRIAAVYYERHVAGLGEQFIAEAERLRGLLGKYPAVLMIVAVAHMKRRPGYWRARTK